MHPIAHVLAQKALVPSGWVRPQTLGPALIAGLLTMLLTACTALVQSTPTGTEVTVTPVSGGTLVHIYSPQGIGRAVVTFPSGLPDGELAFRLDLSGLEHFEIA